MFIYNIHYFYEVLKSLEVHYRAQGRNFGNSTTHYGFLIFIFSNVFRFSPSSTRVLLGFFVYKYLSANYI